MATLTEALKEAYAIAPADVVALDTLEFIHPMFLDEQGQPTSLRVVRDLKPLSATLEPTAPLDPGQTVTFIPMEFLLKLPDIHEESIPSLEISVSNISAVIARSLEQALEQGETALRIIYRPYLSNDTSVPHMNPPLSMHAVSIALNEGSATFRAKFIDLANMQFPLELYDGEHFPELLQ
jgi:hypothetical protein